MNGKVAKCHNSKYLTSDPPMSSDTYIIHTDGGSRGNPGPAAIGAVIERGGEVVQTIAQTIGSTTNNQAEYQAVHAALSFVAAQQGKQVEVYADSELVVKQLRGEYKMKNAALAPWFVKIKSLENSIGRVQYHAIPREDNAAADALVNQALDASKI